LKLWGKVIQEVGTEFPDLPAQKTQVASEYARIRQIKMLYRLDRSKPGLVASS